MTAAGHHRPRRDVRRRRFLQEGHRRGASSRSSAARSTWPTGSMARPQAGGRQRLPVQPPGAAGRERRRATTTSVHLVSKAHLEGFYYKPRIDKELLAERTRGPDRALRLPEGRGRRALRPRATSTGPCDAAGDVSPTSSGADNFFLELQDHGIAGAARGQPRACSRSPGAPACRWSPPTTCTTCSPSTPRRTTCCSACRPQTVMSDPKRMRYGSDQFYMKSGERDVRAVPRLSRGARATPLDIAERCNVELRLGQGAALPHLRRARRATRRRTTSIKLGAGGPARALRHRGRRPPDERGGEARSPTASTTSCGVIEKTGFINYFLVVWDFVRFAREQQHPGRARAAAPARAASWPTRSASPASTRCATT